MYRIDYYVFPGSIEWEYKCKGKYGAKGEKRGEREKPTPEQMARQNQMNREHRVRRLIKANFQENDYWVCLKYPAGSRPELETVKEDMRKFLRRIRGCWKKKGYELKYVYRLEIGKNGGPHVHIIVNRIPDADLRIKENWGHGNVDFPSPTRKGVLRGWQAISSNCPMAVKSRQIN